MGTIFGKQSVAEPGFDVILSRRNYEIRSYGTRFAAQVQYRVEDAGTSDGTPFGLLARYIGVFGKPENEGEKSIAMTAPVVKQAEDTSSKGTPIDMTAPVVKSPGASGGHRIMQFILPAEYKSIEQIPKPTNPKISIQEIAAECGAVLRYNGSFDDNRAAEMAQTLADSLKQDGVFVGDKSWLDRHYQFWGECVPARGLYPK
jgi:hypothetical protein